MKRNYFLFFIILIVVTISSPHLAFCSSDSIGPDDDEEIERLISEADALLTSSKSSKSSRSSAMRQPVDLRGKVVLVTGGSGSIGSACGRYFASLGMKVVLAARREEPLQRAVASILRQGGEAVYVTGDVASEADQRRFFAAALEAFGAPVSMTLAAAGSAGPASEDVTEGDLALYRGALESSYIGSVISLREAVKAARQLGASGSATAAVVLVSSAGAVFNDLKAAPLDRALPFLPLSYLPAKAAVNALGRAAAQHYAREGVRVYLLSPFAYRPQSAAASQEEPQSFAAQFNPVFPGSLGRPRDLARIVWHLFENTSGWRPGNNILADHDATFSANLYNELLFDSPVADPVLHFDQVLDITGKRPYDFSAHPSPTVKQSRSSDDLIGKLMQVLDD